MSSNDPSIFEESPEELEGPGLDNEAQVELRERWEHHQKDLLTHAMDFNVQTLVSLVEDGNLDLFPDFERRDRWDIRRKSSLIESFLLNIPVPPVFLNEDDYGRYSIIDGKQRITALVQFLNNEYPLSRLGILKQAEGKKFSDLDPSMQRALSIRGSIRAIILNRLSDPSMKYEVFSRLNTGGVPLNAQELRNAVHPGPFNRLTVDLSEDPNFQDLIGGGPGTAIWREMRDVELVLRYFTLVDNPMAYRGSMMHALSTTLEKKNALPAVEIEKCGADFLSALAKCRVAFGETAFRRWRPERHEAHRRISVGVYEAQMVVVREFEIKPLSDNASRIQEEVKALFSLPDFQEPHFQYGAAHGFHIRVQLLQELLNRVARG
ncbi:DUF262 domain-containing protein [Streptomyces bacillaris]